MLKQVLAICFTALLFFSNYKPAKSDIDPSEAICRAQKLPASILYDHRSVKLYKFLSKHNSPLAPYAGRFVYWADHYGIDWRLVPAISGVESTFGKRIPKNSYNAYGWNNGAYKFTSWENSIEHVTKTLKLKYIDRGATSVNQIARIYAPPSKTWAGNVNFFMSKIDNFPLDSSS